MVASILPVATGRLTRGSAPSTPGRFRADAGRIAREGVRRDGRGLPVNAAVGAVRPIDDSAMLLAEMRSELLLERKSGREGMDEVIRFFRSIIEDPDTDEEDRQFQEALLRGFR